MKLSLLSIVCIICIFQLLLFIFFLVLRKKRKLSNMILTVFLFAQVTAYLHRLSVELSDYFFNHFPHLIYIHLPFIFLWGPSLYLYVRSITDQVFFLRKRDGLHLLPFLAVFVYVFTAYYIHGAEMKRQLLMSGLFSSIYFWRVLLVVQHTQLMIYIIFSLISVQKYRNFIKGHFSNIEKINLSWLRIFLFGYILAWLVTLIHNFLSIFLSIRFNYNANLLVFLLFFGLFNLIYFKGWTQPEIFSYVENKSKVKTTNLSKDERDHYFTKIELFMKESKLYLQPSLTLRELADALSIPYWHLSYVINDCYRLNFFDFINQYRIEDAKKLLLNGNSNKKTVLEILYEVGFNSKSSFNAAFKKHTGVTPTEFRKSYSSLVA